MLSPFCIFTPESSEHVAAGLNILAASRTPFAVRSGGHTPIPGASGIDDGVLVASDGLKNMTLVVVGGQQVARVGPGIRWIEFYEWLAGQGLTAIGGRYA